MEKIGDTGMGAEHMDRGAGEAKTVSAAADELLMHPDFSAAARFYGQLTLEACRDDRTVIKLFGNSTQHVAFSLIASLSAQAAMVEGAAPLTPSRLIKEVKAMGLSSHGKVEALINRLRDQGLITKEKWPGDGRVTVLAPTEAFFRMDDALNAIHAKPAAMLTNDPLAAQIAAGDRAAARRMRAHAVPTLDQAGAMLQRAPQILHFVMAEAGWLILLTLVDAIERGDARARRYEAIAKACAVTRPHVRTILNTGRDYGFLTEEAPGLFALTPAFRLVFDRWIAEILAAFLACCALAQAAPERRAA